MLNFAKALGMVFNKNHKQLRLNKRPDIGIEDLFSVKYMQHNSYKKIPVGLLLRQTMVKQQFYHRACIIKHVHLYNLKTERGIIRFLLDLKL